jgi:hypothetical protein
LRTLYSIFTFVGNSNLVLKRRHFHSILANVLLQQIICKIRKNLEKM